MVITKINSKSGHENTMRNLFKGIHSFTQRIPKLSAYHAPGSMRRRSEKIKRLPVYQAMAGTEHEQTLY